MQTVCRSISRDGFTLAELVVGLMITALVGAGVLAISTAVAAGWKATEASQHEQMATARTMRVVQGLVRQSRLTGYWQAGSLDTVTSSPATLMIWRDDGNGDGRIQTEEVVLLQHEPSSKRLLLYEVAFANTEQRTANNLTWDNAWFYASNTTDEFKGQPFVRARVVATDVSGASLCVVNESDQVQRPSVEFQLRFAGSAFATADPDAPQEPDRRFYGTATLRTPATRPAV
jgi:Tfp pilus assembly protein FimT